MEQKLLDNEIDLALVENETSNSNIKYMDFLDDEIVVVTGTQSVYAKRKNIKLSDIQEIPLVLREKGSGSLQVIQKALAKQNIDLEKLNILIHLGSTEAIKNFLCDFDGIALISEKSIEKEIQLKSLCKLNVSELNIYRKLRMALRQGPELKIPALFIDFLQHYNF
jgi:DNA-binding transcriptional LysR family regulator